MVVHCPRCGRDLPDNANYCLNCGKAIRVAERTGLPTAGGILAIICACACLLMGFLFISASVSGYYPSYRPDPRPTYFSIAILNFLAFAVGLFSGIHALKRGRFRSTVFGTVVMSVAGIAISVCFIFEPYSGWLTALIFGVPIIVLSALSAIFVSTRRNEFVFARPVYPKPPTFSSPPMQERSSSSSIRCLNCGHNNPENFKYCGKCGTALQEGKTQIY